MTNTSVSSLQAAETGE